MADYGYPVTTNRAGRWFGRPRNPTMAAQRADPNAHLSEILRPVKQRGIQSVGLLGLDTEADKLGDLVNHDPKELKRLALAIRRAVDASRISHPHIIGKDPGDHEISQAETKRRIGWCIEIAQAMRFDVKPRSSLDKICTKLPHWLGHYLDGTFWSMFKEKRQTFAKKRVPTALARATANQIQ